MRTNTRRVGQFNISGNDRNDESTDRSFHHTLYITATWGGEGDEKYNCRTLFAPLVLLYFRLFRG